MDHLELNYSKLPSKCPSPCKRPPLIFDDPVVHKCKCYVHKWLLSVSAQPRFLVREFQVPMGAYSGDYSKACIACMHVCGISCTYITCDCMLIYFLLSFYRQSVLVCHDKVATRDLYFPASQFPRVTQDPADVILSESSYNLFSPSSSAINPFSRDMPSNRKEMASIVFLERTNRPLVRGRGGEGRGGSFPLGRAIYWQR